MLKQFVSYNIVGIANTLLGFLIIFILMFGGVSPLWSNAIGYGVGAISSYVLNKKYTFKLAVHSPLLIAKFFMVLVLAYVCNYMALQALLPSINPYFAQVLSAIIYTTVSFTLAKLFVFTA